MKRLWMTVTLLTSLAIGGQAATINFSGAVTGSGGIFELLYPVGTPVQGTITANEISEDQDGEESTGYYLITNGSFSLNIGGETSTVFANSEAPFTAVTFVGEGLQQFQIIAPLDLSGLVTAFFEGGNGPGGAFLTNDAFPTNPNWSNLTSGFGSVQLGILATAKARSVQGDEVVFSIDSVNEVPEPGTMLGVAVGGLAIWWKRRRA